MLGTHYEVSNLNLIRLVVRSHAHRADQVPGAERSEAKVSTGLNLLSREVRWREDFETEQSCFLRIGEPKDALQSPRRTDVCEINWLEGDHGRFVRSHYCPVRRLV